MPQRNGQNPIKVVKDFVHGTNKDSNGANIMGKSQKASGICHVCKAEVPPKPGFRFSSLKCPKCGASMGKK